MEATDLDDTSLADVDNDGVSEPYFQTFTATPLDDGDSIDRQGAEDIPLIKGIGGRHRSGRESSSGQAREAKSTPPSLDEWSRFFSNVVLRVGTEFFINAAFSGIDEDVVSDKDLDRLAMSDEEKKLIAVPFAELSHKSKFMRKHGRMIVASGDAANAIVVLGVWMGRVRRIAAKYRPKVVPGRVNGSNGNNGQNEAAAAWQGSAGGRFQPGFDGGWANPGTG